MSIFSKLLGKKKQQKVLMKRYVWVEWKIS